MSRQKKAPPEPQTEQKPGTGRARKTRTPVTPVDSSPVIKPEAPLPASPIDLAENVVKLLFGGIGGVLAWAVAALTTQDKFIWLAAALGAMISFVLLIQFFQIKKPNWGKDPQIVRNLLIVSAIITILFGIAAIWSNLPPPQTPTESLDLTLTSMPGEIAVIQSTREALAVQATATRYTKATQAADAIARDKLLCMELSRYGNDVQAIYSTHTSMRWGFYLATFFLLVFLLAVVLLGTRDAWKRHQPSAIVFSAIALALTMFFFVMGFVRYPDTLVHPRVLALGQDIDSGTELLVQCDAYLNPPVPTQTASRTATLTPFHTPTPSSTFTPTVLPSITPTQTATVNYTAFTPRPEPEKAEDFLWLEGFNNNDRLWAYKEILFSQQIKNSQLITNIDKRYNSSRLLLTCENDCSFDAPEKSLISIQFTINRIQSNEKLDAVSENSLNNLVAGIVFGSENAYGAEIGTPYYFLAMSNSGQVRLYYSTLDVDLLNIKNAAFEIPKDGKAVIQLDVYDSLCPGGMEACAMIYVNGRKVQNTPVRLESMPNGHVGTYAIIAGTAGYTRLIYYDSILVWVSPSE